MKYSNKLLVEVLILFVIASVAVAFFFVVKIYVISGNSMLPTLKNGERILVDKRAYIYVNPIKGDIVGLIDPNEPRLQYLKRIVAQSGDTLEVKYNEVSVNGLPVYEVSGYIENKTVRIPQGYYFVIGDNRELSYDSRQFGLVPESNIIGKAIAVVWPLGRMRIIK